MKTGPPGALLGRSNTLKYTDMQAKCMQIVQLHANGPSRLPLALHMLLLALKMLVPAPQMLLLALHVLPLPLQMLLLALQMLLLAQDTS